MHFYGNCKQAVELYKRAFGAEVKAIFLNSDADPADYMAEENHKELVYHSEIIIGEQRLFLNDATDGYRAGNQVSLLIHFDTVEELKAAYEVIAEGAEILSPMESTTYCAAFVSLLDKYGVQWELMAG